MSPQTVKYHSSHGLKAVCDLIPTELETGQLRGILDIETPQPVSESFVYEISECRDIMVTPFEVETGPAGGSSEIRIKVTGHKPKFVLEPATDTRVDLPRYSLFLPPLEVLPFYEQVLEEGLTDTLVADLMDVYDNGEPATLHQFRDDGKKFLGYGKSLQLQKQIAEYNSRIRDDLAETRHRRFKNMPCGQNAGGQFPATTVQEFQQRIAEYERQGLDTVLGEIDGANAVEMIIDDASSRDTYLDDVCDELDIVAAYAGTISLGHFVNVLCQTLLEYAPTGEDDITADTIHWQDSIQLNPQELVTRRFGDDYTDRSHVELRDAAYESRDLDLFKQSIAAAADNDTESFYHAAADLLYWYTEITSAIPLAIRPRVYAVAEGLYGSFGNTYMTDAADFRKSQEEGIYQLQREDYRAAGMAFSQAYNIATQKDSEAAPFDEGDSFMQIVETNIRKYRDKGQFLDGLEEAEDGLKELRQDSLAVMETSDEEMLLEAWKDDLLAQHQQQDGRFEEAIETTGEAIGSFRRAGAETEAETAQTRRLQLEAITAQLELDFEAASDIHEKAAEEIADTNRDTAYFHECQATVCDAKQALLDDRFEDAVIELQKVADASVSSSNLLVLTETSQRYNQRKTIDSEALLRRLETQNHSGSTIGRHISYNGDYVSVAILLSTVQTFRETNVPAELLDQIIRAALKDAISGGTTREWQEISELSQIDTENIWRRLLPSAFIEALEDVDQMYHQPGQNYAAPALRLLTALEGYLRMMAEYYARVEHDDWRAAVETRDDNISLGDLEMFFTSDPATDRIDSVDLLNEKLAAKQYFQAQGTLSDVRNDLGHNNHSFIDEKTFMTIRNEIHEIMQFTSQDIPVVAEIIDVRERTGVHSASLDWSRLPRQIDFQTTDPLKQGDLVYLPPEMEIESGFADVDENKTVPCTSTPDDSGAGR